MRFSNVISTVSLLVALTSAEDAPVSTNNVEGVVYEAFLPDTDASTIRGYIAGASNANGTGIDFNINFYGLPDQSQGPFLYRIHASPVSADGNCATTLGNLDPYLAGDSTACDATQPETCQVGDLSGKHGNITTSPWQTTYLELYTSTVQGAEAFFGNRSIVVHSANLTALTCANFTQVAGPDMVESPTTAEGGTYKESAAAAVGKIGSAGVVMGVAGLVAAFFF